MKTRTVTCARTLWDSTSTFRSAILLSTVSWPLDGSRLAVSGLAEVAKIMGTSQTGQSRTERQNPSVHASNFHRKKRRKIKKIFTRNEFMLYFVCTLCVVGVLGLWWCVADAAWSGLMLHAMLYVCECTKAAVPAYRDYLVALLLRGQIFVHKTSTGPGDHLQYNIPCRSRWMEHCAHVMFSINFISEVYGLIVEMLITTCFQL